MCYLYLCRTGTTQASLSLIVLACCALLGGCGQLPLADYSRFGSPRHTRAILMYTGDVLVLMEPEENQSCRREGLSIVDFESKTGSKGNVFIHYPKGIMEMQFIAYDVKKATSDMMFEWKIAQKGKVVQKMQVRIASDRPVRVFVNEQEIGFVQPQQAEDP